MNGTNIILYWQYYPILAFYEVLSHWNQGNKVKKLSPLVPGWDGMEISTDFRAPYGANKRQERKREREKKKAINDVYT